MTSPLRLVQALSLALLLATTASAQLLDHVAAGVGSSGIVGNDVAIASDGSHYMSGTFRGTATFGSVSITAWAGSQWDDAFLVKHDADGVSQWARRGGTNLWNDMGNAVAAGPDGSVYWVGAFTAEGVFDGGDNPDLSLVNVADWDVFIARYDPAGNIQWLRGLRGAGQNIGQGVTVDAAGNVYAVGLVRESATIGDVTLTSAGSSDGFIVKLDPDGEALWGMTVGGIDGVAAYEVDPHPDGGIVVSGQFRGVALFGNIPMQSAGLNDTFAARIDADGDVLWATQIGAGGDEFNRGVAVAPDGAVYLTGSFEQQILVGTDILTSAGASDVYVVKLDSNGTPVWGRRGGGSGFDFGEAVAVDHQGNVYASGYVDGTGTFSTGNGDEHYTSAGFTDAYLAVYSPGGDLLELELVGNTNVDRGSGVAVSDQLGRLAVSGFFRGSLTVGNTTVTGVSGNDAFIAFGNTVAGPPPVGSVVFVDAAAAPGGDGQSWTTAFDDLQDALDLAREFPAVINQVWVASGTYFPTTNGDRTVSFELVDGVELIGGFAGDEASPADRPSPLVHSVLSGNIGNPDLDEDNSLHVVLADGVTATLDGFVIRDGYADQASPGDPHYPAAVGGGLRAEGGSLTLRDVVFEANQAGSTAPGAPAISAGGGAHITGGTHSLTDVAFAANQALGSDGGRGGALLVSDGAHAEMRSVLFTGNSAHMGPLGGGGALSVLGATFHIDGAHFEENTGLGEGAYGGGAALFGGGAEGAVLNATVVRNVVEDGPGGGFTVIGSSHVDIVNTKFLGNRAASGGGLFLNAAGVMLVNALLVGNVAENDAAGPGAGGGGLVNLAEASVINSTFASNEAESDDLGQGIRTHGGTTHVHNSILWPADDRAPIATTGGGTTDINRALVRGGYPDGTDVITGDPLFTQIPDPGADGQWGTEADDYGDLRLLQGSPAIDFGLTEFLPPDTYDLDGDGDTTEPIPIDLAGEPRIQGNDVDLGAYESPFAVSGEVGPGAETLHLAVYPNPARDAATIDFSLPNDHAEVRVEVFDVLGRRVALLHDGPAASGTTSLELDARGLPAGLYLVRIAGDGIHLPATTVTVVR